MEFYGYATIGLVINENYFYADSEIVITGGNLTIDGEEYNFGIFSI